MSWTPHPCLFAALRVHVRLALRGVIADLELLPANVHDTAAAEELLRGLSGRDIGDRNYWKPVLRDRLPVQHLTLMAPFATAKHEKQAWPRALTRKRYRIETVFGQLVGRFQARQVWARDAWHLCSRWLRRIVAHCFGVYLCQQHGLPLLQFSKLVNV